MAADQTLSASSPPPSDRQRTRLNRPWLIKSLVFLIVFLAFGVWGLVDATIIYPNRGLADASYKQRLYLETAREASQLSTAAIADPVQRRALLTPKRDELERNLGEAAPLQTAIASGGAEAERAQRELRLLAPRLVDARALAWLDSLAMVGRLDPSITNFADPEAERAALEARWTTATPPKPLAAFDLPLQWGFTVIGFGGALWVVMNLLRAKRTVYAYDPVPQTLILPDGRSITPADIAEFDKRRWDKFFITLGLKNNEKVTLDLYRHAPLEEWILAMERTAFPEAATTAAATATTSADDASSQPPPSPANP